MTVIGQLSRKSGETTLYLRNYDYYNILILPGFDVFLTTVKLNRNPEKLELLFNPNILLFFSKFLDLY